MRKKGFIIFAVILAAIILTISLASCATNESGTDVTVIKHAVTFDVNGGNETYSSREYEAGATLTDLPTPTRDGYEFDCWKDSDGYEYSVESVMPDRDITLVAQWTENANTSEKHEMRFVEPVDPSCVNKGNIGYWHCEICNKNFTDINGENPIDEVDLPMLEHELEFVPCKESSCVQEGNIDYYYCKNCNKLFNDSDAKTELLEKDIIIPATGIHQIEDEWVMVKEPTLSELGLKEKKCKTCSYKITQDVDKIDYEYTEGISYELNEQGTGYEANGFTSDFDVNCSVLAVHAMYKGLPVTSIKTFSDDNNKITKFIIPETIKSIGYESLYYYSAHENLLYLKEFCVVDTNPYFCSVDGVLYNKDMTELVCYPMNKKMTTFNIPSTIKTLKKQCFSGAKISVLNCNEGLEVIEGDLFNDANYSSTVVTVNLPSTLKVLGSSAFNSGMKIENINGVPSSIEYVGASVIDPFMESYQYTYYKGGMYLGNVQNPYLILARHRYFNLDVTVHPDTKIIASGVCGGGWQSYEDSEFIIPDNVEIICGSIFNGGTLGKIYIGKNAKIVSENPFGGVAHYLTEIAVSEENPYYTAVDGVLYTKDLKKLIYYPCDKTDRIYSVLQGCEEIAPKAFAYTNYSGVGREMLQQIILPDTLKKIGSNAFENRVNLMKINIPASVSEIGEEAFYNCNELKEITLPDTLTIISKGMFYGCSSLKTVNMPNSITIIEDQAFWDCGEIETINIPKNVKKIGNMAFDGCCSLKYVIIPESVIQIGSSAFATVHTTVLYCESKAKPAGWNNWWNSGSPVVWDCKNNSIAGNGYIYIEKGGLNYGIKDNEAYLIGQSINLSGNIVIPEKFTYENNTYTVTKIDQRAFINCRSITSIFIPKSVTNIGYAAFSLCPAMTIYCEVESQPSGWNNNWTDGIASVVWDCNNNDIADDGYIYTYVDGIKFAIKDGVAMLSGQRVDLAGVLLIPSKVVYKGTAYTVITIEGKAFENCSELTSVIIPDSVESIKFRAFYNCNSLVSVTIGNGVDNVGLNVFEDCSSLENVTIGNKVTSISQYAFRHCYSLSNVIFKNVKGWWCAKSSTDTSGTSISSSDLTDPVKAANYLSVIYSTYYWKRP